ncbi:hypothetical protein [Lichenifustis flavocetrariae]|uniref:Uncharacterized protein n=1 Tax=Lichenifustis flavocetrariae TaxID=2949735 RepID=A0AA41YXA2_9HYPH|nr:hypothetical protein [Lichenifustis flavocetrariae]MCW6509834.1 hypothetical protein [Lichenifustis flavocetrariae]
MATSASSSSFVINAVYTYTFANTLFEVFAPDPDKGIHLRPDADLAACLFAIICSVMTFRYFFGNNKFLEDMFKSDKEPGVKLFHFLTIILQSVVLLAISYLVRRKDEFVDWLACLFAIEVFWYVLCMIFDRDIVRTRGRLDRKFFISEMSNASMLLVTVITLVPIPKHTGYDFTLMFMMFALNCAVDAWANMRNYMDS